MTFRKIKLAIYSLFLTNLYGFKAKPLTNTQDIKKTRFTYAKTLLEKLKISVKVENQERLVSGKQYLILSNHRGIIDPLILEMALEPTDIFGYWISKKELYNSFFYGVFVRNSGAILLDREQKQMSGFFAEVKKKVKEGSSIFIFPEGTRNKSDEPLIEFKEGFRIIALKNRLPILPVYIETRTDKALGSALDGRDEELEITIKIGEEIDYKCKDNIQEVYKNMFNL